MFIHIEVVLVIGNKKIIFCFLYSTVFIGWVPVRYIIVTFVCIRISSVGTNEFRVILFVKEKNTFGLKYKLIIFISNVLVPTDTYAVLHCRYLTYPYRNVLVQILIRVRGCVSRSYGFCSESDYFFRGIQIDKKILSYF